MSEQITASAVISFCSDWEDAAARFYQTLSTCFDGQAQLFGAMAAECVKHKALIQRTYQETVTDALETGYSFEGLNLQEYVVDLSLAPDADLNAAIDVAVALEKRAIAFYEDVARRSQSLLATIPRAFERVAQRRSERLSELEAMRR